MKTKTLVALCWLGWLCVGLNSMLEAQGDRPQLVYFYGSVLRSDNKPAGSCQLRIVAPGTTRNGHWLFREIIDQSRGFHTTTTTADGEFDFKVDVNDPNWIGVGSGLVIARTADDEFGIVPYSISRGLIDLPLELKLAAQGRHAVRVLDQHGRKLANISIAPAQYGHTDLSTQAASLLTAVTDDQGIVRLPKATQALNAIYASSPTLGYQFLRLTTDMDGQQHATVIPTVERHISFVPPEGSRPEDIGRIEWDIVVSIESGKSSALVWQHVTAQGTAPVRVHLPNGRWYVTNDAQTGHGWVASESIRDFADQSEVTIQLARAAHVTGLVMARDSGLPLSNIVLQKGPNGSPVLSGHIVSPATAGNSDNFEMWLPERTNGVYPFDPLEEYFLEGQSSVSPEAKHAPSEARFKPFEMTRCASTVGTVLDADGRPVAGVTVECESRQERFTVDEKLLTDRYGNFRFKNVADGTPVRLSVMDKRGMTKSPLEVTLNADQPVVVRLNEVTTKSFHGRIVDAEGKPISGAEVEVQMARIIVEGNGMPDEYAIENTFGLNADSPERFTTDPQGNFESDECVDWRHSFLLKVSHPRYYAATTWLRPVGKSPDDQSTYDFGDVTLEQVPEAQKFTVQVADPANKPLANAKVIMIQTRDFAGKASTNSAGQVEFAARKTSGVIAAQLADRVVFQTFTGDRADVKIQLANTDQPQNIQPGCDWPGTLAERRALLGRLLKKFEIAQSLDFEHATFWDAYIALDAAVFADPTVVRKLTTTKRAELDKNPQLAGRLVERAVSRNPELAGVMVPFMHSAMQAYLYNDLTRKAGSDQQRQERLSTALAIAKKLDGDERAMATGRLAMTLLCQGDVDLATEIVSDVWGLRSRQNFDKSQSSKRGWARFFFPQLALVDFDKSCQLIREHAHPNEIEMLENLALAIAVTAGKTDWKQGLARLNRTSLGESVEALVNDRFGMTPLPTMDFVESLLVQLHSDKLKGMLLIHAAVRTPNVSEEVRREWINRAANLLQSTSREIPGSVAEMLAYDLREEIHVLGKANPAATRRILFCCLEDISDFRDGLTAGLPHRIAYTADALAGVDFQLSRTLLQPLLDDFSREYAVGFRFAPPALASAAKCDPQYAIEVAERLIDGPLAPTPDRHVLVLQAILDGISAERN